MSLPEILPYVQDIVVTKGTISPNKVSISAVFTLPVSDLAE